ncbi:LysR family transcriptional regulator [soil metagenome]
MNVHHLELFYYVARHGGVSAAARHMPYGIQQPAISAQILQLEDTLGVSLFHRRPFKLTKAGEELYTFSKPFFGGLDAIGEKLRGGAENHLRISSPEIVQRDYLHALLVRMRSRIPGFQFTLFSGREDEIEGQLMAQDIDVGLATLAGRSSEGVQSRELIRLPMVLLVSEKHRLTRAEEIWSLDRIDFPLITLPAEEPVCRLFQAELQKRKIDWFPSLELSSLELISRYVAEGFGVGLSLHVPGAPWPPGIRALPLADFTEVAFAGLWIGKLTPIKESFLHEAAQLAQEQYPKSPLKNKPSARK